VKIAFLFFLLITHWCGAPASWAARHTTVCLDLFVSLMSKYYLEVVVKVIYVPFTAPDNIYVFVTKLMILLKIFLSNTLPMLLRMEIGL